MPLSTSLFNIQEVETTTLIELSLNKREGKIPVVYYIDTTEHSTRNDCKQKNAK